MKNTTFLGPPGPVTGDKLKALSKDTKQLMKSKMSEESGIVWGW
jgi:hypothetical protein